MPYFLFYILILAITIPLFHNLIVVQGLKGYVNIPEDSLFSGDNIDMEYKVVNNSPLPIIYLEIQSDISKQLTGLDSPKIKMSLNRRTSYIHRENLLLNKRGFYEVGIITVTVHDIFGFYSFTKDITTKSSLLVYPKIINLSTFNIGSGNQIGELLVHNIAYEDRSRPSSLREYRQGDSIKAIHWKLSAKINSPLVIDYESRGDTSTIIFIDNESSYFNQDINGQLEDKAVEIALGIVNYCLNHNIKTILNTQNKDKYIRIKGQQQSDLKPFLESLAKFKGNGSLDIRSFISRTINEFPNIPTIIIITPRLDKDIGAEGMELKFKNLNPIFIVVTDMKNNINYVDNKIKERLRQENIPLYILDDKTNTKESLEVAYGFNHE